MNDPVKSFYDDFTKTFLRDITQGNRRIDYMHQFFHEAIAEDAKDILVIGCGAGQGPFYIANHVAPNSKILALDLSPKCIQIASSLFNHPHISFKQSDVVKDPIEGTFDYIILPDVFEHIPLDGREGLHKKMGELLRANGRILITVPSPGHQAMLREKGTGLQIIDEDVTLDDMKLMADQVGGTLVFFRMVSVWNTNDYIHGVVEKNAEPIRNIDLAHQVPIKAYISDKDDKGIFEKILESSGIRKRQREQERERILEKIKAIESKDSE